MGKKPCEQVLLFIHSKGTDDDSSNATCIKQHYKAWSLTNQNILNYEGYQKLEKSTVHTKHESQHQRQKGLERSILRKLVAQDVLNATHPLSSLLPASIKVASKGHSKLSRTISPSTGRLLLLSCGQTLTELMFGFILVTNFVANRSHVQVDKEENGQLLCMQIVYTQSRAVVTTYLLTTCLWVVMQVVGRQVGKKSNLANTHGQLRNWKPTENCLLTTYNSSFMVHCQVQVHYWAITQVVTQGNQP